jgi:hypothetical protein
MFKLNDSIQHVQKSLFGRFGSIDALAWNYQGDLPADKFPEQLHKLQGTVGKPIQVGGQNDFDFTGPNRTQDTPASPKTRTSSSCQPRLTQHSQSELSARGA